MLNRNGFNADCNQKKRQTFFALLSFTYCLTHISLHTADIITENILQTIYLFSFHTHTRTHTYVHKYIAAAQAYVRFQFIDKCQHDTLMFWLICIHLITFLQSICTKMSPNSHAHARTLSFMLVNPVKVLWKKANIQNRCSTTYRSIIFLWAFSIIHTIGSFIRVHEEGRTVL